MITGSILFVGAAYLSFLDGSFSESFLFNFLSTFSSGFDPSFGFSGVDESYSGILALGAFILSKGVGAGFASPFGVSGVFASYYEALSLIATILSKGVVPAFLAESVSTSFFLASSGLTSLSSFLATAFFWL